MLSFQIAGGGSAFILLNFRFTIIGTQPGYKLIQPIIIVGFL